MISVKDLQRTLELEQINAGSCKRFEIDFSDINRPGLQLADFWDYFPHERPQVLGKVEMTYLEQLEPHERSERLKRFMSYHPPFIIICRSIRCPQEMMRLAQENDIWMFSSALPTSKLVFNLTNYLNDRTAPRMTRHGVLVDVYGVGILITGDSGVGKSEAALELVKRGHRLVADDVVDIKRMSDKRLVGESPEVVRHFMEIRGIGIIDISAMYGIGSVIHSKSIDMVVNLELWKKDKEYDRLGLTEEFTDILDVKLPLIELPIRPGRNVAIVLEVAARNYRLKQQGYNAARELDNRLMNRMARGEDDEIDDM